MIIILCLYIVALWLVFSKFKLVRWGWLSGTVSVLIGVFILATFLALFNCLNPGQAERASEGKRRAVPNRPGAFSIQGRAIASVARRGKATDRDLEIEFRAGHRECRRSDRAGRVQRKTQRGHSEACNGRCQHGIPGAGPPESIRDGAGAAQRGQSGAAERKTRAGFRDRWRQHNRRADSGATRERGLGIIADDDSRTGGRLRNARGSDRRRPGAADALRDVVHCRERDYARRNVLAEWFSDHQGRRFRRY